MKTSRFFSVLLILCLITAMISGCVNDVEKEPEEDPYEYKSRFVSFVTYKDDYMSPQEITVDTPYACRFSFSGEYLEQLNALLYGPADVKFSLYKWDADYDTTVSGAPVKEKIYSRAELALYVEAGLYDMELKFEPNEVGAGDYLYVISAIEGSTNRPLIYAGHPWTSKNLPEDYEQYGLTTYVSGVKSVKAAPVSSFVYAEKVEKVEKVEAPFPTGKDAEGTAKVIILAGQSNAEGVSKVEALASRADADKYAEYKKGYSNVKIMYNNVLEGNVSDGFVDTSAGQGTTEEYFGPELGIAEYLAEHFPNEKFYIIKYAKGGSILDTEWYSAKRGVPLTLANGLCDFVRDGLARIEAEGLTPKIIGFAWNQGESDSLFPARASRYYDNLSGLAGYIRETFSDYASARGIAFIDAAILHSNIWSAYRHINMQKEDFAALSPINLYIETYNYDIKPLEDSNDVAHFGALSMIRLGNLYGAEIGKMIS